MSELTSVILTMWNQSRLMAKISQSAIANIRKYTDPKDYELIIIDDVPKNGILDPYGVLLTNGPQENRHKRKSPNRTVHVVNNEEDNGYCAAMNQGAKLAKGKYLCFIENDIYVWENWLTNLRYYLENDLSDVIGPWQIPVSFADMKRYKELPWDHPDVFFRGMQEQGVMMMEKALFEKTGGWDERFKKIFGWKAYYPRLHKVGARINNTAKVQITHLAGATYWNDIDHNCPAFRKQESIEGQIIHDEF